MGGVMKRSIIVLCALLGAAPVLGQEKTSDQATEEGRQQNTRLARDGALTTKVHTALMNNVGLNTLRRINVDSDNGVVTLKGVVDSEETKKRAEEVTRRVSGVSQVKNELSVKGG
ncbi:MAG: BON domain-containing protein [Betaproteobacteria bacterium]|nr:BON domain-containing protein [Betaproteobacteria bacterium]